jgi:hypothetical protein
MLERHPTKKIRSLLLELLLRKGKTYHLKEGYNLQIILLKDLDHQEDLALKTDFSMEKKAITMEEIQKRSERF